jgi:uncharacterized membrane protein YraQ (UPF0718 family)
MKTRAAYVAKHRTDLVLVALFGLAVVLSFALRWDFGLRATEHFMSSLMEMISFLPAIFILVGLVEAWVPREVVAKHTGEGSGWRSSLWMILLAMLQVGPLYGAFPVAYLMWKKGTSTRNIFIYLGAFTSMKLPMIGFEIGFLGLKFTLLRTALAIPVFVAIAVIIDRFFGADFAMSDGANAPDRKALTKKPEES